MFIIIIIIFPIFFLNWTVDLGVHFCITDTTWACDAGDTVPNHPPRHWPGGGGGGISTFASWLGLQQHHKTKY
jgi:hypothetical protein